jgi:hypothetical protein
VVNFLTFRVFRKPLGNSFWFMFLLPLGIQLRANAFIAYTYKHISGYGQGFSIPGLIFFYTTRPRFGWVVLTSTMRWGRCREKIPRPPHFRWAGKPGKPLPAEIWNTTADGWYESSAKGTIISEMFLLLIASYYNGRTVHFATAHGYCLAGHLKAHMLTMLTLCTSGLLCL